MKSEKKPIDFALPLRHFVGILFFFVIAVTCLQVISRYVFNNPLIWSEESVRFMVVWMCMVGSAVSNFDDDHMMINIIVEKFPRPVQFVMYTVRQLLIVVFCVACSYYSIPLLRPAGRHSRACLQLAAGRHRGSGRSGADDRAALVQRSGPLPPRRILPEGCGHRGG